jgi:hypothetical protein
MSPARKSLSKKRAMTEEHKTALAAGRSEGLAVRRYLEALESAKPRRGRRPSPETIENKVAAISERLANADPLTRLHLIQEQRNLVARQQTAAAATDLTDLEAAFVGVAAAYGARKGIDYATWRSAGVPAEVLREAGISR